MGQNSLDTRCLACCAAFTVRFVADQEIEKHSVIVESDDITFMPSSVKIG